MPVMSNNMNFDDNEIHNLNKSVENVINFENELQSNPIY